MKRFSLSSLRPSELDNGLDLTKFEGLRKELAEPTQRLLLIDQYEEFFDLSEKGGTTTKAIIAIRCNRPR